MPLFELGHLATRLCSLGIYFSGVLREIESLMLGVMAVENTVRFDRIRRVFTPRTFGVVLSR